jgi:hypothetical protein
MQGQERLRAFRFGPAFMHVCNPKIDKIKRTIGCCVKPPEKPSNHTARLKPPRPPPRYHTRSTLPPPWAGLGIAFAWDRCHAQLKHDSQPTLVRAAMDRSASVWTCFIAASNVTISLGHLWVDFQSIFRVFSTVFKLRVEGIATRQGPGGTRLTRARVADSGILHRIDIDRQSCLRGTDSRRLLFLRRWGKAAHPGTSLNAHGLPILRFI